MTTTPLPRRTTPDGTAVGRAGRGSTAGSATPKITESPATTGPTSTTPIAAPSSTRDTFGPGGTSSTTMTALPLASKPSATSSGSPLSLRLGGGPSVMRFGGARLEGTLDAETASKARPDNRVKVLYDGVQSFAERSRMIAEAKTSIHLQTFIFTDDDTGRALADQLMAKAREGVDVRVIIDGLGSNRSKDAFFDEMRAAGVKVLARETGLNPTELNNRWHEKHLIVDGRVAVTGGMNIGDEYALGGSGRQVMSRGKEASEPWRDVDVRIEGAAVHDEQRAFLRNWIALGGLLPSTKMAAFFPKPVQVGGGAEVRVVQQHPAGEPPEDHILKLYLHAITAATKSITIENAYFVPPKELRDALIDAARRGVQVRVLTNSKESSDMGFVVDAARYFYDELLAAGVEIHEQEGGTLHSKTASFDGQYAIIGSYNLNGRSAGLDTEAVVAIRDDVAATSLDTRFNEGIKGARQVTPAELAEDGFVDDVKQWMFSLLSWTI